MKQTYTTVELSVEATRWNSRIHETTLCEDRLILKIYCCTHKPHVLESINGPSQLFKRFPWCEPQTCTAWYTCTCCTLNDHGVKSTPPYALWDVHTTVSTGGPSTRLYHSVNTFVRYGIVSEILNMFNIADPTPEQTPDRTSFVGQSSNNSHVRPLSSGPSVGRSGVWTPVGRSGVWTPH
jgi:hypothetical protein